VGILSHPAGGQGASPAGLTKCSGIGDAES
jgi:hypothetical protein